MTIPPFCKNAKQLPYGINCYCKEVVSQCNHHARLGDHYKPICPFHYRESFITLAPTICKYYEALSSPLTLDTRMDQLEYKMDKLSLSVQHLFNRFDAAYDSEEQS